MQTAPDFTLIGYLIHQIAPRACGGTLLKKSGDNQRKTHVTCGRWVENVACILWMRNLYNIIVGKPEGKRTGKTYA
jgi:hypothetical protein